VRLEELAARAQVAGEPEESGLSLRSLERIPRLLAEDVAAGLIPGAVLAVQRGGKLVYRAQVGFLDRERGTGMRPDARFRIYSMTKPLLAAATLSLIEDGGIALEDPVSSYLPEFADVRVQCEGPFGPIVVAAEREPTIRDLMRHTSGICGGVYDASPSGAAYSSRGLVKYEHTAAAYERSLEEFVGTLAQVPLAFHPGSSWGYGFSGDVLGRVLEVASGNSLDVIFDRRVFVPLAMSESGFFVRPEHAERVAEPIRTADARTPEGLITVTRAPRFLSGGSGCYSTADDYLRFVTMLLNRGTFEGRRTLAVEHVDAMLSDQIGSLAGIDPDYLPGGGYGFGFGLAVRTHDWATTPGHIGDYYWVARSSSTFFADPSEDLAGVLLMQRHWLVRHYQRWFKTLVYQAILD
jgi:CubicO group peptidase (beta-lactamase class C family)